MWEIRLKMFAFAICRLWKLCQQLVANSIYIPSRQFQLCDTQRHLPCECVTAFQVAGQADKPPRHQKTTITTKVNIYKCKFKKKRCLKRFSALKIKAKKKTLSLYTYLYNIILSFLFYFFSLSSSSYILWKCTECVVNTIREKVNNC